MHGAPAPPSALTAAAAAAAAACQATKADARLGTTDDPGSLPSGRIVVQLWNAQLQPNDVQQEMQAAVAAGGPVHPIAASSWRRRRPGPRSAQAAHCAACHPAARCGPGPAGVQQPQLGDGIKYFKAPSLAATGGTRRRRGLSFDPRGKWQQVRARPQASEHPAPPLSAGPLLRPPTPPPLLCRCPAPAQTTLIREVVLRYETAGTLVLRDVLRPAHVPAHAALVRQHGDSVAKHLAGLACKADPDAAGAENRPPEGGGPGGGAPPPPGAPKRPKRSLVCCCAACAASLARLLQRPLAGNPHSHAAAAGEGTQQEGADTQQTQAAVKQEPAAGRPKRVKREAGGEDAGEAAPMQVDGRAVREDEYALCDLSQADNVPGWTVHKRQAQPVEELEV